MTEWVVQAEKLDKLFDDKQGKAHALKQVDFLAKKGKMTALIGPDGAGKTTTMRLICGLMDPTGGSLKVLGLDSGEGRFGNPVPDQLHAPEIRPL